MTAEFQGMIEIYTKDNNVFRGLFAGYVRYGMKLIDATDKIHNKMYTSLTVVTSRIVNVKQLNDDEQPSFCGENLALQFTETE